jgi:antitoxin (DNA-binding transcriptional repressor) of toxin-antitoxin stability system
VPTPRYRPISGRAVTLLLAVERWRMVLNRPICRAPLAAYLGDGPFCRGARSTRFTPGQLSQPAASEICVLPVTFAVRRLVDSQPKETQSAHMKTISIRDLHLQTGKWVRHTANLHQQLIILDRGRPTARLMPLADTRPTNFGARHCVTGFDQLPAISSDSTQFLEEDRR